MRRHIQNPWLKLIVWLLFLPLVPVLFCIAFVRESATTWWWLADDLRVVYCGTLEFLTLPFARDFWKKCERRD